LNTEVLFGTEGCDHETVKAFAADFKAHNGDPVNVTAACLDMSKAFIKGVNEALPNAEITFDSFHLIKHMNDALSEVRTEESKIYPAMMKSSRYAFLKNPENLTQKQDETLTRLCGYRLKTARAYLIKLALQDVYFSHSRTEAEARLKDWYGWAIRCQLLWMGKECSEKTLPGFFEWFGEERRGALRSVCSEMWTTCWKVIAKKAQGSSYAISWMFR
jgi:hypothetical protein